MELVPKEASPNIRVEMPWSRKRRYRIISMSTPLISILINNFNYAKFLSQSIESALAQTYPNVEVVVVDDCSTDGSRQVLEQYADGIVTVLQEKNGGQAAAINSGFRASHGDIIMMLDSDDYLYPHAAGRVAAESAAGCSKWQYRLDFVDATGNITDTYPQKLVRFDSGDVVPRLLKIGRYETTVTSGNAFSRNVLQHILPVPEEDFRISADGYLVTLAPFYGTVISIDETLGAYRQHGGNSWWSGSSRSALGTRLRRSLQHDERKYHVLAAKAREFGFQFSPNAGLGDHQHLEVRLASLQVEPAQHPYPGDSRKRLGVCGAMASTTAKTTWPRRGILAAWFLAVGFLPNRVASRAVMWRLARETRPLYANRVFKILGRMTNWSLARGSTCRKPSAPYKVE